MILKHIMKKKFLKIIIKKSGRSINFLACSGFLNKKRRTQFYIGSSETTRKAPLQIKNRLNKIFDFKDYWCHKPSHIKILKKKNYTRFLEWFIGFSEGDGSFIIRNETPTRPRLVFEVSQKDPKVLFLIRKMLGFGRVRYYIRTETGEAYWTYIVDTKPNIQRIIALFNGNLVLPKRRFFFNKWLEIASKANCLPLLFKNKQTDIHKGISVCLNTAWISGFIDAEGCFYANLSTPTFGNGSKISKVIKQKMHITQKSLFFATGTSGEEKILKRIGELFSSKAIVYKIKKKIIKETGFYLNGVPSLSFAKGSCYRIEICSLASHLLIIQYLRYFQLKTIKWVAFTRWERVVMARVRGDHLDESKIPKLIKLTKAINKFAKESENWKKV
nr:hypothetical protein [Borodinellopsis texensis]